MNNEYSERLEPGGRLRVQRDIFGERMRITNGSLARFTLTSPATIRRLCAKAAIPMVEQSKSGKHWSFAKGRKFWSWAWRTRLKNLKRRQNKKAARAAISREPVIARTCPDWLEDAIISASFTIQVAEQTPQPEAAAIFREAAPLIQYLEILQTRSGINFSEQ